MAYELRSWKEAGCVLTLKTDLLSDREPHSEEINRKFGEGGGLNANYRTVEAIAKAANMLGLSGLTYGEDFVFKSGGDEISFDFHDQGAKSRAQEIFGIAVRRENGRPL